ncbi:tryptophan synthase beta subunit-like PLP-dependent enzyme [Scenedesmus sp. NREL 46B-D3]|nr:tryptophan synthase beta subunit-like PLP-dependent enzyme [Scenedesmus sp. NREL 46B-D3]
MIAVQRSCSFQECVGSFTALQLTAGSSIAEVPVDATSLQPEMPTIDQVVGNTPMVRLQRLTGLNPTNKIFVKLEGANPGGSAKDRPALAMLNAAEACGRLTPGGHVIECTTGNTGIALAAWCAARGYKLTIIMPDSMTEERKGVLLDQNNNPANPASHEATTGVEIWRQTNGKLTHFIAGMGTSGTLTGCARALKARSAGVTCIGLEPPADEPTGVPGIRRWPQQYRPSVRDDSVIDGVMGVSRREAEETARALARSEGLLLGVSAAGAVSAALRLAAGVSNATIVVLACDRGDRYLSTGVFSAAAGAADPAPCPPSELASVVARVAAAAAAAAAVGDAPIVVRLAAAKLIMASTITVDIVVLLQCTAAYWARPLHTVWA